MNQSQISRSRQYRQENERTPTEWMWSGLVPPCQAKLSLTKTGEKAKRAKERGGAERVREKESERDGSYGCPTLSLTHTETHTYVYLYLYTRRLIYQP